MRILIVDDHEAVRKGVCAILSARLDIAVCGEAINGKEAVEKATELKPDLIILDVTMPVLNGFDAAREIRKILPEAKILMLSMHESKQLVEEAKRLGVHGYVTKTQASQTLLRLLSIKLYPQKNCERYTPTGAACANFDFLGLQLDTAKNISPQLDQDVSTPSSSARVLVVQAQEDWAIARETWKLAQPQKVTQN